MLEGAGWNGRRKVGDPRVEESQSFEEKPWITRPGRMAAGGFLSCV